MGEVADGSIRGKRPLRNPVRHGSQLLWQQVDWPTTAHAADIFGGTCRRPSAAIAHIARRVASTNSPAVRRTMAIRLLSPAPVVLPTRQA